MKTSVVELKGRVRGVKSRPEVLRLRDDIRKFIDSPQFKQLSEDDRDNVMELLAEVHSKEDQYTGGNPLNCAYKC